MSTSTLMPGPAADRAAWQPSTAFVLAGGAALGAMQAGMVYALDERGIAPDLLIGASAGALNAAFLASRPATMATAQERAAIWRGLCRSDILPLRPATLLSGLAGRRDHLIPGRALRRLVARHLHFERLEQAAIPRYLVAFDLLGRERGAPVRRPAGRHLYVLPTQNPGDRGLPRPPRAALAATAHTVIVRANARRHGDLARYADSAELIVLPAANPGHIPPTDFGHAGQLITRALAATRTALAARAARPAADGHGPHRVAAGRTRR